jgi:hypothetical protein
MDEQEVPRDEMTAEEAAAAGVEGSDAIPDNPEPEPEPEPEPDERTDDPAPVDNPDLSEDGDDDSFESEPISPGDMDQTSGEGSETREDPADLSGVEKEFDDND